MQAKRTPRTTTRTLDDQIREAVRLELDRRQAQLTELSQTLTNLRNMIDSLLGVASDAIADLSDRVTNLEDYRARTSEPALQLVDPDREDEP